ncbi:lytic murein transglycosylase [Galbitalea sp. SE-J8]|uniref:lytic transglycosylase domain-containing protein n=1 Tax=Galbitalea sp. SE-J8 TaxID=3054952 RepID=UPI00259C7D5D|nr:lytic murein transglycosylase [Galbitalea sp. SE-J8]MDM4762312.1 lytic murein transglycosylase [Galbitalea sp. SE-J8]
MTDAAGSSPGRGGAGRLVALLIAAVVVVTAFAAVGVAWISRLDATATRDRVVAQADAVPVLAASASPAPGATRTDATPAPGADPGRDGGGEGGAGARLGAAAAAIRIDPAWLAGTAAATGVPPVALDAYARATAVLATAEPGCHLGWNTLAGIGRAESAHGTIDGTSVAADGTVTPRIVGPALDGGVYGAIADTDGGAWDGDDRWDRAIGPLQFLPSTWRADGVDASGDGVADPQNLYDASVAAARYLCAPGADLRGGAAWERAIRSYNPADSYLDAVRGAATAYAAAAR